MRLFDMVDRWGHLVCTQRAHSIDISSIQTANMNYETEIRVWDNF